MAAENFAGFAYRFLIKNHSSKYRRAMSDLARIFVFRKNDIPQSAAAISTETVRQTLIQGIINCNVAKIITVMFPKSLDSRQTSESPEPFYDRKTVFVFLGCMIFVMETSYNHPMPFG